MALYGGWEGCWRLLNDGLERIVLREERNGDLLLVNTQNTAATTKPIIGATIEDLFDP